MNSSSLPSFGEDACFHDSERLSLDIYTIPQSTYSYVSYRQSCLYPEGSVSLITSEWHMKLRKEITLAKRNAPGITFQLASP